MPEFERVLKPAEPPDAEIIREHYDRVNIGIHAEGGSIDWPLPYPLERVQNDIDNGRLFCLSILGSGALAATVCLDIQPALYPPEVWSEAVKDEGALRSIVRAELPSPDRLLTGSDTLKLSVSRLAGARYARGSGAAILQLAELWAARQDCVASVLNCATDNDGLRTFYERRDYTPFGRVIYRSPRSTGPDGQPLLVDTTRFKKVLQPTVLLVRCLSESGSIPGIVNV